MYSDGDYITCLLVPKNWYIFTEYLYTSYIQHTATYHAYTAISLGSATT